MSDHFDPLEIANYHKLMMTTVIVRFLLAFLSPAIFLGAGGVWAYMPVILSCIIGAPLAYYGYKIISALDGQMRGLSVAGRLFVPGVWLLAALLVEGYIRDRLYKHFGMVGMWGVTPEQVDRWEQAKLANSVTDS
ncbi:MAG: hypothetical protein AAF483_11555 [Planctomycetota bacterium]